MIGRQQCKKKQVNRKRNKEKKRNTHKKAERRRNRDEVHNMKSRTRQEMITEEEEEKRENKSINQKLMRKERKGTEKNQQLSCKYLRVFGNSKEITKQDTSISQLQQHTLQEALSAKHTSGERGGGGMVGNACNSIITFLDFIGP